MNNITFYFQFVHYSNKELLELKNLITDRMQGSISHLISNKNMNEKYNIKNSIGRIIFISNPNIKNSESLKLFDQLEPIVKKFDQLNLFLVQINDLFFNVDAAKKYLNLLIGHDIYSSYNNIILFSRLYLFSWIFLNMFHFKLNIIKHNIELNSMNLNKIYDIEYI